VSFPEEYEMDYVKKLEDRVVEQELKEMERLEASKRKYQLESRKMEEFVWNE